MNIEKLERLIALLRQNGVQHYKDDKLEIRLGADAVQASKAVPFIREVQATPMPELKPTGDVLPSEMAIPHHVNQVADLLRLSDNELVEKLFPDYSQMKAEA